MIHFADFIYKKKLFSLKACGNSMQPILKDKDIVYCRRISFSKVSLNDILVIKKREQTFIHRVIYKNDNYLISKGDNSQYSDGKIYPKQIIGKVYKVKRDNQIFTLENIYLIQSTIYFEEIVKIKKIFEKEGIEHVFLKGLPLHLWIEGVHPKRLYSDCDILVKSVDQQKVAVILQNFGFRKIKTEYSYLHKLLKDKKTEDVYIKYLNKIPIVLDIHFEAGFLLNQIGRLDALYPQKYIDEFTKICLQEKKTIRIFGESLSILSSDNLVIYLALHFFHHNFTGISRLEFIDKIIRSVDDLSFSRLSSKIVNFKFQNFVYPAFLYLKKYFQTPMTREFLVQIKPKNETLDYIDKIMKETNIFDSEERLSAGVKRFKNIFFLSPTTFVTKLLVFVNPQVIYSVFWIFLYFCTTKIKKIIRYKIDYLAYFYFILFL